MSHSFTEPSILTLAFYRFVYDPLRARQLRRLVGSLGLRGTERVLVFGSGAGSEARYLADSLARGGRVTCLDVSATWLGEAKRRLRGRANVEYVLGDARSVGLAPESFDVIVAHYSLHDVDRPQLPATLAALAQSLEPGGRFVVVEPSGQGHIHHALSPNELASYMSAAGLQELSRREIESLPGRATEAIFARGGGS
jgi:ubiquinone/menaquinone biosynthesis C-methylase UbiE